MKNATEPHSINMILSVLMEEVEFGSAVFIWLSFTREISRICNHVCTNKKNLIRDEQHNIFCLSRIAVLLILDDWQESRAAAYSFRTTYQDSSGGFLFIRTSEIKEKENILDFKTQRTQGNNSVFSPCFQAGMFSLFLI